MMVDLISSAWKICSNKGNLNVCPRGRPGPPGELDPKVTEGGKEEKALRESWDHQEEVENKEA